MVERRLISLPSQLQLIERLQHLIYLSSSLLFVSGAKGAGKSTVSEQLSNALPAKQQQVYLSLNTPTSSEKLRQQIVTQLFSEPLFNPEDRLIATVERLQQTEAQERSRLIIIDNAENIPETFIIELCELITGNIRSENKTNVLLLATEKQNQHCLTFIEEHLPTTLASLFESIELTLPALSEQESECLLKHYFEQQDYQAKLQHQDALQQKLALCVGNPEKIIALASNLSEGHINKLPPSWLKIWFPAVLLMIFSLLVAVTFAVYLFPKESVEDSSGVAIISPDSQVALQASDVNAILSENGASQALITEPLAGSWQVELQAIQDVGYKVGEEDKAEMAVLVSEQQPMQLTQVELQKESQEATEHTLETVQNKPSIMIENETIDGLPLNHETQEVSQALASDSLIQEPALPLPENLIDDNLVVDQPSTFNASEQLLTKQADHYTLQLSGMASEGSLTRFIAKHQLPRDNVFVYQTIRNNKPWFVVIYGDYDTIKAAQRGAKNLPSTFAGINAWVKSWQAVHNDLRLNDE